MKCKDSRVLNEKETRWVMGSDFVIGRAQVLCVDTDISIFACCYIGLDTPFVFGAAEKAIKRK